MSSEWIVLVCSIKYAVTITKVFTYSSSDRQLKDISEGDNTVLHENVYIWKIYLQKMLEITEIQWRELLNYTKAINSKNWSHAICSREECRKGWRSKADVEPKSAPQKIELWGGTTQEGHTFTLFRQMAK